MCLIHESLNTRSQPEQITGWKILNRLDVNGISVGLYSLHFPGRYATKFRFNAWTEDVIDGEISSLKHMGNFSYGRTYSRGFHIYLDKGSALFMCDRHAQIFLPTVYPVKLKRIRAIGWDATCMCRNSTSYAQVAVGKMIYIEEN